MSIFDRLSDVAGLSLGALCMASSVAFAGETSAADMAAEVQKGLAVLIDVREASELVESGMAEPAVWLATSEIKAKGERYRQVLKGLPKKKPIYVYCAVGKRSGPFAEALREQGFKAENFGGFSAWKDAKAPVRALSEVKKEGCPYLCGPLE